MLTIENLQLLVILLLIGAIVDVLFQFEWVFKNKDNITSDSKVRNYTLFLHSFVYATLTYIFTLLILQRDHGVHVWIILFLSHLYIDSRIPINFILKFKGVLEKDYRNNKDYGYLIMAVDQRLHELVILIIVLIEGLLK